MKVHGGKFAKEFAKKTIIADFFQCKLDLILVSLQLFRQAKKEFFLTFYNNRLPKLSNGTKIRSV